MILQRPPSKRPDIIDAYGRAWRCTDVDEDNLSPLSLGEWLVERPGAHPEVGFYCVGGIVLNLDGVDLPGVKRREGATHELRIAYLDPFTPLPDVDRWGEGLKFAGDTKYQVELPDDESARGMCELMVRAMLRVGINPLDVDGWAGTLENATREYRRRGRLAA